MSDAERFTGFFARKNVVSANDFSTGSGQHEHWIASGEIPGVDPCEFDNHYECDMPLAVEWRAADKSITVTCCHGKRAKAP